MSYRLLCPWNSPGKNTGVGCHFLLQGIFLTQGSNLSLLHWQMDSLPLRQLQFSYSVVSDSLRPHGLQHARLPYPSPTPGACSNSCPSSWWCHPTILSSVVPFSSCLQSFPASGSFPMSQFFTLGGQSIGVSASTSSSVLQHSTFFMVQFLHPYTTTGKTIALTIWTFVGKVISLLFNMLSRLVIAFSPRSKCLLLSWLQSPSAVILEPKRAVVQCFHCFLIYLPWSDRTGYHDPSFLNVDF